MNNNNPVNTPQGEPGYISVCGIISLVLILIGFIIPVVGAGFIVPIALIFSVISMSGKTTNIGIAATVIGAIKLLISITFWIQLTGIAGIRNFILALIGIGCIVLNVYFMVKRAKNI